MRFRFFAIPARESAAENEALNQFLPRRLAAFFDVVLVQVVGCHAT